MRKPQRGLVCLLEEVREHAAHADARATLARVLSAGDVIAIAPQVLAEFIHVVTDPRRFTQPLDMNAARRVAEQWWTSSDVVQAFPDAGAVRQFLTWLQQFSLGGKRQLGMLLAATYRQAGIQSLLAANQPDFLVFGVLTSVAPRGKRRESMNVLVHVTEPWCALVELHHRLECQHRGRR